MSSKLSKKNKKKSRPTEWLEKQPQYHAQAFKNSLRRTRINVVQDVIHEMKEIGMYTLYIHFDYSKIKLEKTEATFLWHDENCCNDQYTKDDLKKYVKMKLGIDVEEVVRQIPQDYKLAMAKKYLGTFGMYQASMADLIIDVNLSIELYLIFMLVSIRYEHTSKAGNKCYGMTIKDCKLFCEKFMLTINELRSIANLSDISDVLKHDVGYEVAKIRAS